jgi:hypothetical protein
MLGQPSKLGVRAGTGKDLSISFDDGTPALAL